MVLPQGSPGEWPMIREGTSDKSKIILPTGRINTIKNVPFTLQFNTENTPSKSGLDLEDHGTEIF